MATKPVLSPPPASGPQRRKGWWWRMSQRGRNIVAVTVMLATFVAIFGTPLLLLAVTHPTFAGDPSGYAKIRPGPLATGPQVMKIKLVIVDTATGKIDHVWDLMPPDNLATNPSEVGTVVQLSWSEDLVGHYDSGGSAYTSSVDVTVIDAATSSVIATASFTNQPPMHVVGDLGDSVGEKPEDQVVKYLWGLPDNAPPQDLRGILLWFVGVITLIVVVCWWIFFHAPRKARRRAAMGGRGHSPRLP